MAGLTRTRLLIGFSLAAGAALLAIAEPMVHKPEVSDEVRSLRGIKRLRVRIDPMPKDIEDVGVTAKFIRAQWQDVLTEAGFVISQDKNDPLLRLIVAAATDEQVPDAVAFNPYMMLQQPMRHEQIGRDLFVPTYVHVLCGLESTDELKRSVIQSARDMIKRFIRRHHEAQAP